MLLILVAISLAANPADLSGSGSIRCRELANSDFSGITDAPTLLTEVALIRADGNRPEFCKVTGSIIPNLEIEIRLPSHGWNGKFVAIAGIRSTLYLCDQYVKRGYACMAMLWPFKKGSNDHELVSTIRSDLKARLDFNLGPHLRTVAAKAITTRYYSKPPTKSYLMGCSAGGHSAMVEAQMFPLDYDGIVVGAPNLNLADLMIRVAWNARSSKAPNGQPLLTRADLQALHQAALAECDLDDGVQDGVIGNPLHCHFNPSKLACASDKQNGCLVPAKIAAVKQIYAGPPGASTPTMLPGSELGWPIEYDHNQMRFFTLYFESIFLGAAPPITPGNFDFGADYRRIGLATSIATPNNPDLRKFNSAGGKIIAYLGGTDSALAAKDIIDYYETVERTMGGRAATQEFFRFFLIPGMDHCVGGVGAHAVDFLSYIEAWVERGEAPASILAAHVPTDPKAI